MKNKICVVGGGYWGKNHIRTLAELGYLGGIVDSDSGLLEKHLQDYPFVKTFKNIEESFDVKEFGGYTVATPAPTHFDIAKKIIKSKKHVLVEKPLTLELSDAILLNNLSKEAGVNLMVGHIMLFHPAIIKIKETIDSGLLGKIFYIYSNRLNFGQVRTNEDVLWSLGPHDISILDYFTNSIPSQIKVDSSSFLQKNISDSVIACIKYENGISAHIYESWLHPFKEHRIVVVGSKGMLSFEDSSNEKSIILYKKSFDIVNKVPVKNDANAKIIDYKPKQPLTEELKYFAENMNTDLVLKSNGDHAIKVMKVLYEATAVIKRNINEK